MVRPSRRWQHHANPTQNNDKPYGRNRESVADMELELHNLFIEHPDSTIAEDGNPVIPADALVDVFRSFAEHYGGMELLAADEMAMLEALIASNPGMEVTPQVALAFIAEKTKHSPPQSPPVDNHTQNNNSSGSSDEERGRDRDRDGDGGNSRSSSNDSVGTHRNHSRPPSRGPVTPRSAASPFDTSRRQRSTPLGAGVAAPSSWAKRPPHHRRKSDAGSRSDSEVPSAFGRGPAGRMRTPSNPTSPSSGMMSPSASDFSIGSPPRSSSPPPRGSDSDSDSDDDENVVGRDRDMVLDRSTASSTVSMMPHERVEALQRVNDDLARKLADTERSMQRKLAEQEAEFEDLQVKLEETRNELSAAKREEKELRSKERQNSTQIGALEAEVVKVSKQLETSKASYNNLQRQYMDQCASAEKYRNELREREETLRSLRESASLTQIEIARYAREHEVYEERITQMEKELAAAMQAHARLEEQKQENMLLKETIDRMRFDLDEMRSSSNGAAGGGTSGASSAANTMSKSLGAELLGKMGRSGWGIDGEGEDEGKSVDGEEEEEPTVVVVEKKEGEDEDTEGEDVIQTIITRKKRKVASRATANKLEIETRTFEEVKEYSDSGTQYDAHLLALDLPVTAAASTQTDAEPKILTASFSIQTDAVEPEKEIVEVEVEKIVERVVEVDRQRNMAEMQVQTDALPEPAPVQSTSKAADADAPPAYKLQLSPEEQEEHDWRVTVATLTKYHPGANLDIGVPGGVSLDALEDWRALKEELGLSCKVVDKVLEASQSTGLPRVQSDAAPRQSGSGRRSGRFYNIYNTYVYGAPANANAKHPHSNASPFPAIPPPALWVGGTVLFFLMLGPSIVIPYYAVPGGPTHYDRAMWSSFNTMRYAGEGFGAGAWAGGTGAFGGGGGGGDGAGVVWSFLGRVGGGAARMVRGWPT
ncbi:hypothetical protein C8R46DRAFT_1162963 [Mycena filopes]|nr:hypothetical protein C8R46DRAFT_1162963 [Mycena filopes]